VWVGLERYRDLLTDGRFHTALTNTVIYAVATVAVIVPSGLALAQLLRLAWAPLRPLLSFALLLPGLVPPAVMALLFLLIFSGSRGILNLLVAAPLGLEPIDWLRDPTFIRVSLLLQAWWRWTGLVTLFLGAALEGIPRTYYDIARAEGASALQTLRHVTLPSIRRVLVFACIVLLLDAFVLFEGAYVLLGASGGTDDAGLLVVGYVYQTGFSRGRFATASAMSISLVPMLGIDRLPAKDRNLAIMFQSYVLLPHLTVQDNIGLGLKLRGAGREERRQRVGEVAGLVGVHHLLDRFPNEISGGERQRAARARAIARRPVVFLLDEPLSQLDAPLRAQMRQEIRELPRKLRATMILVTHDQADALSMGDRIAVIKDGSIQQVADPRTLYHQPANRFVAGFIGTPPMSFLSGAIEGKAFLHQEFRLHLPPETATRLHSYRGRRVILGLRAEHVTVEGKASTAERCAVPARVQAIEAAGPRDLVHLTTGRDRFSSWAAARSELAPQERVTAYADPREARFFDEQTGEALTAAAGEESPARRVVE
jgi:multiple sugar transport system ATP-binding protein